MCTSQRWNYLHKSFFFTLLYSTGSTKYFQWWANSFGYLGRHFVPNPIVGKHQVGCFTWEGWSQDQRSFSTSMVGHGWHIFENLRTLSWSSGVSISCVSECLHISSVASSRWSWGPAVVSVRRSSSESSGEISQSSASALNRCTYAKPASVDMTNICYFGKAYVGKTVHGHHCQTLGLHGTVITTPLDLVANKVVKFILANKDIQQTIQNIKLPPLLPWSHQRSLRKVGRAYS